MSAGGRLADRARTRLLFTAEPFQFAQAALKCSTGQDLIPRANSAQALLESRVMAHLGTGGECWRHPLGIAGVQIFPRRTVVNLDDYTVLGKGVKHSMAQYAIERLLPHAEPSVQVNGAIGLRVKAIDQNDLHLTLVDTNSHAILRAADDVVWPAKLAEWRESCERYGLVPLWTMPSLSDHERYDESAYPRTRQCERELAWLGSALLRRIALFHTCSSAFSVRSWISGDEWTFELDAAFGVPVDHDALIDRITDAKWGMPVHVGDRRCWCHLSKSRDKHHDLQCTYTLRHNNPSVAGELQIRFRSIADRGVATRRRQLEEVGVSPTRLDRILPVNRCSTRKDLETLVDPMPPNVPGSRR